MTPSQPAAGAFRSGLPYNRLGHGPRPLVVVQGLVFENKPQPGLATRMYHFLGERLHRVQRGAQARTARGLHPA